MGSAIALAAAITLAAAHVASAATWPGVSEHTGAVAIAWAVALWIALHRGKGRRTAATWKEAAAGVLLFAAACAFVAACAGGYRPLHRLAPLVGGIGLALAWGGVRAIAVLGRALAVLAAPLLSPLPRAVAAAVMPLEATTATAAGLLAAAGVPATRRGTLIDLPGATLEVMEGCSGLTLAAQVIVLALVVTCAFRTGRIRAALVFVVGAAIAFLVNAARVAFLGIVASRAPEQAAYWDRYGEGAVVFPLVGTALACGAWWLLLRGKASSALSAAEPAAVAPEPGGAGR